MSESNAATAYYPLIADQQPEPSQSSKKCSVRGCNQLVPSESINKMCETCRGRHRVYAMTKRARRKQEKAAVVQAMNLHTGAQFVETKSSDSDANAVSRETWTEVHLTAHSANVFNQQMSPLAQHTWNQSTDTQLFGPNETANDHLSHPHRSSTSSELAHALNLPEIEASQRPHLELQPQDEEDEEDEEEEDREASAPLEGGTSAVIDLPESVPGASRRYCSVKGCKELIHDTCQYKMCPSCRVRYRDYGNKKRAKWKAERQAFKVEITGLRVAEDERRKEQGLPPLEQLPEELRAWEHSLLGGEMKIGPRPSSPSSVSNLTSQHPPPSAVSVDTGAASARMCTVSHCHKVLPVGYQYKRCEQHRMQNRYHSRLKRIREKVFKSEGHPPEGLDTGRSSETLEQTKDIEDSNTAHNAVAKNTKGASSFVILNLNLNSGTLEKSPGSSFLQGKQRSDRNTSAVPSAIQPFSDSRHEEDKDAEGETDSSLSSTIFETGDKTVIPPISIPVPKPLSVSMLPKPPGNTGEQPERPTSTANLVTLDDPQVIAPYKPRKVPLRIPLHPRRTKIFQDIYTPNGRIKVDDNQASGGPTSTDANNTTPIYTPTVPSSSTLVYQPVTKWRTSNSIDKNSEGVDTDVSKKGATFMGVLAPSSTTISTSAVPAVSKEKVQSSHVHEIVSTPSVLPSSTNNASQGSSTDATMSASAGKTNPPPPQSPPPSPSPFPPQPQVSQSSYTYPYPMHPPYPYSYYVPPPLHPYSVTSYPLSGGSYSSGSSSTFPSTSSPSGLHHSSSYSYYPPLGYTAIPPPGCAYVPPRYLPPTYGQHLQPYGSHLPPPPGYSHTMYPLIPVHPSCQQACIVGYGQRPSPDYKENSFSYYHHPDSQNTSSLHEVPLQKKRRKTHVTHVLSSGQTLDAAQSPMIPSTPSHPSEWPNQMPPSPSAHPGTIVDSSNQSARAGIATAEKAPTPLQSTNTINPHSDPTPKLTKTLSLALSGVSNKAGSQHERKCAKSSCQRVVANDVKSSLCAKCTLKLKRHRAKTKQRYKLEPRKPLVIRFTKRQDGGRDSAN